MILKALDMWCKDYNAHLFFIFLCTAVSNTALLINNRNDRRNNRREFDRQEKKNDSFEASLKEVAKGQVETDKNVIKVLEVVRGMRETHIKLEEKFTRDYAEREKAVETGT